MLDNRPMRRQRSRNKSKLLMVGIVLTAVIVGGTFLGVVRPFSRPAEAQTNTMAQRNDSRRANLRLMAVALTSYATTGKKYPVAIPNHQVGICTGVAAACKSAGLIDLTFLISTGDIASLPSDPVGGHDRYSSGYAIGRDGTGQILLSAPRAENGAEITETVK